MAEAEADVVIVGGLALEIHGGDYVTYDVDFAYARTRENTARIARALAGYDPRPTGWPDGLPFVWDAQTILSTTVLTLDTELGRVDLLGQPDGAPLFAELKSAATEFDLGGRTVRVASIDDLIAMKRAAGRPKDLGHIAELETIKRLLAEGG